MIDMLLIALPWQNELVLCKRVKTCCFESPFVNRITCIRCISSVMDISCNRYISCIGYITFMRLIHCQEHFSVRPNSCVSYDFCVWLITCLIYITCVTNIMSRKLSMSGRLPVRIIGHYKYKSNAVVWRCRYVNQPEMPYVLCVIGLCCLRVALTDFCDINQGVHVKFNGVIFHTRCGLRCALM